MALGRKTGGRKKGSKNRFPSGVGELREAAKKQKEAFLKAFVDNNRALAEKKWADIGDPADAFKLWLAAAEYAYPKLGRLEHTGEGGGPVVHRIERVIVDPAKP
jgi:hypothetical protein